MDSHLKLTPDLGDPLPKPEEYQKLVGKLIYLTITKPDITYTVHVLSQFMHCPTNVHHQAAIKVLRYLARNPEQDILFASQQQAKLQAYCDSDWAGCPNTRRSTTGFCILLGQTPISWKAKRQSVVSRSSAEAELRSMAMTICEVMWVKQLLKDLGMKDNDVVPVYCDNQATLAITANPVHHDRTKHAAIDCHFLRDKAADGTVQPAYVPTSQQVADIFTKSLPITKHYHFLNKLGVQPHTSLSP